MNDEERRKQFQSGSKALSRIYQPRTSSAAKSSYATLENKTSVKKSCDESNDDESDTTNFNFNFNTDEHDPLELVPFKQTNLHSNLLKTYETLGLITTKQVQIEVLNFFSEFSKSNLKICAPRKSGKTTAVIMCFVNEILKAQKNTLQCLIVCPTLELAESCNLLTQKLIKFCSLNICYAVKGKSFKKNEKVKEDIIIATPEKASEIGAVLDFKRIRYFFIDDADCLRNPKSHFQTFTKLCQRLPPRCQTIVTADLENKIIDEFLKETKLLCHDINVPNTTSYKNIKKYFVVHNHPDEKLEFILHFLKMKKYQGQAIICCDRKTSIVQLEESLQSQNIEAVKLFGDLSAAKRQDILQQFNSNKIQVLISTQAFLRVVNSDHVTQVINTEQLFDSQEGLLVEEYDRRKCVLSPKKPGIFISLIEDTYQEFFFADKVTYPNGKNYFHDSEIITVECLKSMIS